MLIIIFSILLSSIFTTAYADQYAPLHGTAWKTTIDVNGSIYSGILEFDQNTLININQESYVSGSASGFNYADKVTAETYIGSSPDTFWHFSPLATGLTIGMISTNLR